MKRLIIYSVLASLIFFACRKEDNSKLPDLIRVPLPTITKDTTGDATISRDNPNAFKGKFTVDLYFKNDIRPKKLDIVAIKNGDHSKVVSIKENVNTFPSTIDITGPQLATLFGEPIKLGDRFTIGADVTTQDGQKYAAFPPVGVGYGSGVTAQPGASPSIDYLAVCVFNINDFVGTATIDDPDFWGASYSVSVSIQGTNTYKITGWVEDPTLFIIAKVNPVAQTVTIDKQVYSNKLPTTSFTNPAVAGTGTIDACNKKIVMSLTNTVDQGSFGTSTIILKK